jgi:hypothetical protein
LDASKGKKYVFSHWQAWEAGKVKMESRAKEVEQKFKMSRKDFFKTAKELRKSLESPIQNAKVTV